MLRLRGSFALRNCRFAQDDISFCDLIGCTVLVQLQPTPLVMLVSTLLAAVMERL